MNYSLPYSPLESNRFNRKIYRGYLDRIDIDIINEFYATNDAETLIIRFPVSEQCNLNKLEALNREIIFADTLICYKINLNGFTAKKLENNLHFKIATKDDKPILNEIIPLVFKDYSNHYLSNPKLNSAKIIDGYVEWGRNHIDADNKVSFLVYKENRLAAFAICSYDNKDSEGVLYGVMPNYSGIGIYSDLIRYTQSYFSSKGSCSMKVSTQIQNYSVQRIWIHEGFNISHAFLTIHLNKKDK